MKYVVAAVSSNTNSFGLYQHVLVTKDGTAFTACANSLNKKDVGQVVDVKKGFHEHSFEIPQQIKDAPDDVVQEVWKDSE